MMFRPFLLLLVIVPVVKTCIKMIPPEEYYPTSTLPEEPTTTPMDEEETTTEGDEETTVESTTGAAASMCGDCDVDAIAPELTDPNTIFEPSPEDPVDGCLRTLVNCRRTDSMLCNSVAMYGETATATELIGENTNAAASAVLSCDADGTYSWMNTKGITKLSCEWTDCF